MRRGASRGTTGPLIRVEGKLWQPLPSPQALSRDEETEDRDIRSPPMATLLDRGA